MPQNITIAGVQMDVKISEPTVNVAAMTDHVQRMAEQGIFLVAFPECALSGYCFESKEEALANAVDLESPYLESMAAAATDFGINLVFGFLERRGKHVYNSAALMMRDGTRHFYRKVHLPKLGVDNFTTPGREPFQVVDVEGVKIGLIICYDCSFPESARILALAGADLIVLPTNWPPGATNTASYLPNARALENHVYFLAVNRVGEEGGFRFIGKSRICHPNGSDLAFADHDGPAVLNAEIDFGVARNKHLVIEPGKHEIHRFDDRRPEMYNDISQ